MDIEEAKDIYWMMENCYQADCMGQFDCKDCDYFVTQEEYGNALTLLQDEGLLDEEGELI